MENYDRPLPRVFQGARSVALSSSGGVPKLMYGYTADATFEFSMWNNFVDDLFDQDLPESHWVS